MGNSFEYTVEPYTSVILKIPGSSQPGACPSKERGNLDCSADEKINNNDLSILLSSWAVSGSTGSLFADLNNDNLVNEKDLTILLKNWGN